MNYDDEDLERDYTAPAPTNRIQTLADLESRSPRMGDKLTCLDDTWLRLFKQYRSIGPCIATLYIEEVLPNQRYRIGISDLVREAGNLTVPAGITTIASIDDIRDAIKASEALRTARIFPNFPQSSNSVWCIVSSNS
jgi:hypothetical protein